VDSKAAKLDEERSMLTFTPRNPKSPWSKSNKDRVARLTKEGRMAKAGLESVATAKANGAWTALDSVEALEVPHDLAQALAANREASANFVAFPPSSKKSILWWVESAKRPETREKRIRETVDLAAQNIRAHH
jgi:uncharacterized protein YdeI (YjbR/CyaY-like superfamily)